MRFIVATALVLCCAFSVNSKGVFPKEETQRQTADLLKQLQEITGESEYPLPGLSFIEDSSGGKNFSNSVHIVYPLRKVSPNRTCRKKCQYLKRRMTSLIARVSHSRSVVDHFE